MPKDLISIEWERWDPSLQTVKVSSHISPVFGLGHGAGVCVSRMPVLYFKTKSERNSEVTAVYGIRAGNLKAEGLAPKIDNKTMCWRENKQLSAAPASRRLGRAGLEAPPLRGRKILSF